MEGLGNSRRSLTLPEIGLPRRSRRALRSVFTTLVAAVVLNLLWAYLPFFAFPSDRRHTPSVDVAWGSLIHRLQNHPVPALPRPVLPRRDDTAETTTTKTRVLLVTFELEGLHQNGGIGTAFYELATALALEPDFDVSVVVSRVATSYAVEHVAAVNNTLAGLGVRLHFVDTSRPFLPALYIAIQAKGILDFLRATDGSYDLVHFPENLGLAYFSLLAKHEGLVLNATKTVVGLHGAQVEWSALLNKQYPVDRQMAEQAVFERKSVELADAVVSPSEYMLHYVLRQGWAVPPTAYVVPNVVSILNLTQAKSPSPTTTTITELVFFGRLEERKGVKLFLEALEDLFAPDSDTALNSTSIKRVTFLGRDTLDKSTRADVSSLISRSLTILQHASALPFTFEFLKHSSRPEALAYLANPERLVVLPALADNSPSTVLECIAHSVRFVASDVGGIPELVHPADRRVLFQPVRSAFVQKIRETVETSSSIPPARIRPAPQAVTAAQDWANLLRSINASPFPVPRVVSQPLVSICITHFERADLVVQLLDSLLLQTYTRFEVILIDDGSPTNLTQAALDDISRRYFKTRSDWTLLRTSNAYLGEARNRAASHARGSYLLFLDDDDVLKPHALTTLVHAASHSGADALSTWLDEFSSTSNPLNKTLHLPDRRTYWFSGPSLAVGVLANCFGSGNIFVTRSAFEGVGGFSTFRDVGGEDWEFYIRLALGGYEQLVVPEELIFVRSDPTRASMKYAMDQWEASFRATAPLLSDPRVQELGLAPALLALQGVWTRDSPQPTFADSVVSFEGVQGWNGWTYSFEPLGPVAATPESYKAISIESYWATENPEGVPMINAYSQQPYKGSRGTTLAAVRTFRSPKRADVTVVLAFSAEHSCGDGTLLKLVFQATPTSTPEVLFSTFTKDRKEHDGEFRHSMTLWKDSTLQVVVEPLETHDCDLVNVRLTLTTTKLESDSWSRVAAKLKLAERAERAKEHAALVARQAEKRAAWLAASKSKAEKLASRTATLSSDVVMQGDYDEAEDDEDEDDDNDENEIHLALIFDDSRLPHALGVVRSAQYFLANRTLHFHLVAPVELHEEIEDTLGEMGEDTLSLYDHALCTTLAVPILPFSSPAIHISAHCKMFLSQILDKAERVLYLDTDVTVVGDISPCYTHTERPTSLISMSVDMGDACQSQPDLCWPIGLHWRVPDGLTCGHLPSHTTIDPPVCPKTGDLETVQVNGGVILLELERMRTTNFVARYVQSVVNHYRIMGTPSQWGEQDFINSYFRYFPNDLELLPCGCNYQWWGFRAEIMCSNQPVYIAHHWAHGIAGRYAKPYTKLFYHFLDANATEPVPAVDRISRSVEGSPNSSAIAIIYDKACPQQSHDCSAPFTPSLYGERILVLSRLTYTFFADDLIDSVSSQLYSNFGHLVAASSDLVLANGSVPVVRVPLELDIAYDNVESCQECVEVEDYPRCPWPPLEAEARSEYFVCLCDSVDNSAKTMDELENMAIDADTWILSMNDDQLFVASDSLALLMAELDSRDEVLLFRANGTRGEQDLTFRPGTLPPKGDLAGVGYLYHASHADESERSGLRCESWRTLVRLSQKLPVRWISHIPVTAHPLQRHLPQKKADDFRITVVILATRDHGAWVRTLLEEFTVMKPSLSALVKEILVVSGDEQDVFLRGEFDDIRVVIATAGSGLQEVAAQVKTKGVLLLSDTIVLDKAALTALINVWLDNPLRLVGPFIEPNATEFYVPITPPPKHVFWYNDEPDPILGPPTYSHLLPRALLASTSHLTKLSDLLRTQLLHPRCHPLLLNGIATRASGLPPLRVVPPPASFLDRIHDCRNRNYPDIVPGPQPGDVDPEEYPEPVVPPLPSFSECMTQVGVLLGDESEWSMNNNNVAVTGVHGTLLGIEKAEGIDRNQWRASRRSERCIRDFDDDDDDAEPSPADPETPSPDDPEKPSPDLNWEQ